jgi:chemotaxis protein methyltransferase CheR
VSARERLAVQIEAWFGLDLARGGRLDALERVVGQRAASGRFASPDAYVSALEGPNDPEVVRLLETVTVGHTWFFRDREQTEAILSELRSLGPSRLPAQVWVAGCSTGEDAYTVALLARAAGVPVEVLGTDINPFVLDRARAARYAEWSTRQVPAQYGQFFASAGELGPAEVHPDVRRSVRFERHNLVDRPLAPGGGKGWDVILCRNVLIYFRREVADRAIAGLCGALRPGGWLFLGAAEVLRAPPAECRVGQVGARLAIQRMASGSVSRARSAPPEALKDSVPPPEPPPEDMIAKALSLTEAGHNGEAIMLCAKTLQADPFRAEAHLVSGIAYHLGDDPHSAARELRSALLLAPELWPALFYLGQALEKLGRYDEAKEAYVEADLRSRAAPSGRLGVLEAYKTEMAALARARARREGSC